MFKILLMYHKEFSFYKDSLLTFLITLRIYANPHLLCTILERDFLIVLKNVRVQALSNSVKFIRQLMQKIVDLLSCDLTTSKDQSYLIEIKSLIRGRFIIVTKEFS